VSLPCTTSGLMEGLPSWDATESSRLLRFQRYWLKMLPSRIFSIHRMFGQRDDVYVILKKEDDHLPEEHDGQTVTLKNGTYRKLSIEEY
jgi:hypothetical protein